MINLPEGWIKGMPADSPLKRGTLIIGKPKQVEYSPKKSEDTKVPQNSAPKTNQNLG